MSDFLIGNLLYGQSGGPSPVINASAYGVINEARKRGQWIQRIFAMHHGIQGLLNEDFIDIAELPDSQIDLLPHTPGAAFGSVRYKLKHYDVDETDYKRILEVFKKYNIRYFFYNGGNDSMDTCYKISEYCKLHNYECRVVGIPKTIDNDLPITDHTPGYGSAAKFIANAFMEISYDNDAYPTGRVNIVEVMGRHAGWLTAASALATHHGFGPDLIYVPEVPFDVEKFKVDVKRIFDQKKRCLVAVSEGTRDLNGEFVATVGSSKDAFGHKQLGGVASTLLRVLEDEVGLPCRAIEISLLQRCASHLQSKTDVTEAIDVGSTAVKLACHGKSGIMVTIKRESSDPYIATYSCADLKDVANVEFTMPRSMINEEGNGITREFIEYVAPLIEGGTKPIYRNGVQQMARLQKFINKKDVE